MVFIGFPPPGPSDRGAPARARENGFAKAKEDSFSVPLSTTEKQLSLPLLSSG